MTKKTYITRLFTKIDWMEFLIKLILKTGIIAYLFFDSYKAVLLGIPIGFELYHNMKRKKNEKREKEILVQFKEMIQSLASSLSVGYSLESAFEITRKDMELVLDKDALIFKEMDEIRRGLKMNLAIEKLLKEFGKRTGNEDIKNFANVIATAKKSGGNINHIIQKTVNRISDKLTVEEEIITMIASKKMEEKVMMIMPYGILFYMKITSGSFLEVLYHNFLGQSLMFTFLILIYVANYWAEQIMEIKV